MQYYIKTDYFFKDGERYALVSLFLPTYSEFPFGLKKAFLPNESQIYLLDEVISYKWGTPIVLDVDVDHETFTRSRSHQLRGESWISLEEEVGGLIKQIHLTLEPIIRSNADLAVPTNKFETFNF